MNRRPYIAVAGGMGSGKTTLARGLAASLGWSFLPESVPATLLLDDLFDDPGRWAFETQTGFLVNKAIQLRDALSKNESVILDRTLYEDADVFARYFYDHGYIDERSFGTYLNLAGYFFEQIRPPDLVIYCHCSIDSALARLSVRKRQYIKSYPPNHVEEIHSRGRTWLDSFHRTNIVVLNTDQIDTRRPATLSMLAAEIRKFLVRRMRQQQFDIFESPDELISPEFEMMSPVVLFPDSPEELGPVPSRADDQARVTPFPTAYIAAPFTAAAATVIQKEPSLIPLDVQHGRIKRGPYRSFLLNIERGLRNYGINSFIPHRDINEWGSRMLLPGQVTALCANYVRESDLFVGVLSVSHGSHFEFGIAQGMNKPCIVLRCKNLAESFVASGVGGLRENTLVLDLEDFSAISDALRSDPVASFLNHFTSISR